MNRRDIFRTLGALVALPFVKRGAEMLGEASPPPLGLSPLPGRVGGQVLQGGMDVTGNIRFEGCGDRMIEAGPSPGLQIVGTSHEMDNCVFVNNADQGVFIHDGEKWQRLTEEQA